MRKAGAQLISNTSSIGAIGFLLNMIAGVFAAVIKALKRFDIFSIITFILSSATMLGIVFLLYKSYDIVVIVIYNVTIGLISIVVYGTIAKRLVPGIKLWPHFNSQWFRKLFGFGGYSMVSSFGGIILFQLHKILIGVFIGPAAVTVFAVPQNLAKKIHELVARAVEVLFPVTSELHGTRQLERLKEIHLKTMRFLSLIVLTGCLPLIPLTYPFLELWIDQDFARDSWLVFTLLLIAKYKIQYHLK